MPQTTDAVRASWDATLSAVIGRLQPVSYSRRIVSMAINGPANSILRVYRGYVIASYALVSSVFPASNRLYDSLMQGAPIVVHAGEAMTFAWTEGDSGVGETGLATITSQWGST